MNAVIEHGTPLVAPIAPLGAITVKRRNDAPVRLR
jgi:hypothetical protein